MSNLQAIHVGVRETLKKTRRSSLTGKIVDSDADMEGAESGEDFEVKLNAKTSLQG